MAFVGSFTEKEVTHLQRGLSGDPSGQLYITVLGQSSQQQGCCSPSTYSAASQPLSLRAQRLRALLACSDSFRGMDMHSCDVRKNHCEQGEEGRAMASSGLSTDVP